MVSKENNETDTDKLGEMLATNDDCEGQGHESSKNSKAFFLHSIVS